MQVKAIIFRFIAIFVLLFILTLSFPHPHIPDVPGWIAPIFEKIARWVGDHILQLKKPYTERLISDSTGLYIHLLVILVFALIGSVIWSWIDRKRSDYRRLQYFFTVLITYYLAFHLLVYGFNKIFKWQFYMPEPNTLFTTMGNTYRDLLYWSTMGTSHSYNVFLGVSEVIAALLLLFRRTRLLGALAAFVILLNIVMINFSFDISVKVYSCFLLLLSVLIAFYYRSRLLYLVSRISPFDSQSSNSKHSEISRSGLTQSQENNSASRFYYIFKSLIIGWMFWSVLTVYVRSGNYNDDKAARPPFHGAYDIPVFIRNIDTLPPLLTDTYRWRRLFVHRRGYLIIQGMNDEMRDYSFSADTILHRWSIRKEGGGSTAILEYEEIDPTTISLYGVVGTDMLRMVLKKIDLNKLPVMKKEFNWTVD